MKTHSRSLTSLEIQMAQRIFSDGIQYEKVKLYSGIPYLPQNKVAISPNGHIYFPKQHCPEDFCLSTCNYQTWLIHELTHVWQYQNGFKTWFGGFLLAITGGYLHQKAYIYPELDTIQNFNQLNMEQQADLLAHYYAAKYLNHHLYTPKIQQFETILQEFLNNPKQKDLLPHYQTAFR